MKFYERFLKFYTTGTESTQLNIKVFCARQLFMLLKVVPTNDFFELQWNSNQTTKELLTAVVGLLRDKRQPARQIGIKIASFV